MYVVKCPLCGAEIQIMMVPESTMRGGYDVEVTDQLCDCDLSDCDFEELVPDSLGY